MKSQTKQHRTSAEIELFIRDGSTSHQRKLFIQKKALDDLISRTRSALAVQLATVNVFFDPCMREGVELRVYDLDCAISNVTGNIFALARPGGDSAQLSDLLALETVLDSPETRAAIELLQPLFDELAEAKVREAAEAAQAAQERQAKIDVIEARKAALEAEIEAELAAVV